MQQFGNQFSDNKKMRITGLLIQDTGTYNPMYIRPYTTHVTKEAANAISDRVNQTGDINYATFSGIAGSIIAPSAVALGEIPIPNGWGERRLSFVLTLEHESTLSGTKIIYVQGYTEYHGIAGSGSLDPRMKFFINSITTVARNTIQTPMGLQYVDRIVESSQVINGRMFTEYSLMNNGVYGLRPSDVFMAAQTIDYGSLNDTRVRLDSPATVAKTSRKDNVPTSYLASLTSNYNQARALSEFGGVASDVYGQAASMSGVGSATNNEFIRAIELCTGMPNPIVFDSSVLESIDPNVGYVTNYARVGSVAAVGLHTTGQSEHWNGANRETVAATLLSNAIPAIMMELMINKVHFRSTNHDIGSMMTTIIIDAKSITNMDLSRNIALLKSRIENELLFDLTYGNQISYMLEVECSIFGESRINISFDSGPVICYATPSFCDSLLAPVYTVDRNALYTLSHDMGQIFTAMAGTNSHNPQINSLI
jgi:hypothetical protein